MSLSSRLTAAMVILVLLTVAAVGGLTYRAIETRLLPSELDRVDAHARSLASELESYVGGAHADVEAFRSAVALDGLIRAHVAGGTSDGRSEAQWRDWLARGFAAELAAKPAYRMFRVIGVADGGREIVRVDRSGPGGSVRRVAEDELQRKDDRDYFLRAVGLTAGQVYMSNIDLNRDHGAIEVPHVPVLRVAAPLFTPANEPFGIIVVNVDMRPVLSTLRATAADGRSIFLANERGA